MKSQIEAFNAYMEAVAVYETVLRLAGGCADRHRNHKDGYSHCATRYPRCQPCEIANPYWIRLIAAEREWHVLVADAVRDIPYGIS